MATSGCENSTSGYARAPVICTDRSQRRRHLRGEPMKRQGRQLVECARRAAALVLIVLCSQHAWSQPRTTKLVVPFPAGGGLDVLARLLAEQISRAQGQTIVIENRP